MVALHEQIRFTCSSSNSQKYLNEDARFANHTLRTPSLALLECACLLPHHTISNVQLALI